MRLLSDYTGRGPTRARTHFNENLITIVVQDLLTKGERSLIRDGKQDLVLETRRAYQQSMGADLTAGIEEITGRQVIAFLSANNLDPELAMQGSTPARSCRGGAAQEFRLSSNSELRGSARCSRSCHDAVAAPTARAPSSVQLAHVEPTAGRLGCL